MTEKGSLRVGSQISVLSTWMMAVLLTEVPEIWWKNRLGRRFSQEFTCRNIRFEKPGRLICRWAFGNCKHKDGILNHGSR